MRKYVEEANAYMALMENCGAEASVIVGANLVDTGEEMPQTTNKLVDFARPACSLSHKHISRRFSSEGPE